MDFRHQIVTSLFSMLRLSFETQKIKENYAIFSRKIAELAEVAWIDMRDNENNSSDSCEITKGLLSL